jgi:glycerol-3-phosphate dehydrogenase
MDDDLMDAASQRPAPAREASRLQNRCFDTLIIGGGINGCGLARDLAMRGLNVALVDKGDIACGASSASTKLVHGGLRYLESWAFRLVFEACRERRILQRIAPHLVQPIPFFIPVYRGDRRPLWMVRAGMALYDLLALFRNTRHHRILSPAQALAREPALRAEGLSGVALYWDCRMDDARLCLENALAAQQAGAEVLTYAQVTALRYRHGRVCGAVVVDLEGGEEVEVEAEVVVNAAGPWLDSLCALDGETQRRLRPTRGTHVLVPRINRGDEALYLTAGRDERLFFVIPWGGMSLIGTTDVDFDRDPDAVTPTGDDVDYLLAEARRHLCGATPAREDVVAAFAGLRPLVSQGGSASGVSREHEIFESPSGLISVGGGKYTTYRAVAAELATRVSVRLGRGRRPPGTERLPLPGGGGGGFGRHLEGQAGRLAGGSALTEAQVETLRRSYGSRTPLLLGLIEQSPGLASPVVEGSELLSAQVVFAARYEMARTPEDILRRRSQLALKPGRGLDELAAVTELLGGCLGADVARRQGWMDHYRKRYAQPFS